MSAFTGETMTPGRARLIAGRLGWLSRQPAEFRTALLEEAHLRHFPAGTNLGSLDEIPSGIACIVDGFADVLVAPGPFPARRVQVVRTGWWFGDVAMISGSERRADTIARTDCWVLHVPARAVSHLAAGQPETWRRFGELTTAHFDNALFLTAVLSAPDPKKRLAAVICWLSGGNIFSEEISDLPVTREEIGEVAGLSRNTAGRALSGLARDGLIEAHYGRIVISDRAGLEEFLRR